MQIVMPCRLDLLSAGMAIGVLFIAHAPSGCGSARKNVLALRAQQSTFLAMHAVLSSRLEALNAEAPLTRDSSLAIEGETELVTLEHYRRLREDAIEAADSLGRHRAPRPWARGLVRIGIVAQHNGWWRLLQVIDRELAAADQIAFGDAPPEEDNEDDPSLALRWTEFDSRRMQAKQYLDRSFQRADLGLIEAAIGRAEALLEYSELDSVDLDDDWNDLQALSAQLQARRDSLSLPPTRQRARLATLSYNHYVAKHNRLSRQLNEATVLDDLGKYEVAARSFLVVRAAAEALVAEASADSFLTGGGDGASRALLQDLNELAARASHNAEVSSYNFAVTRYSVLTVGLRTGQLSRADIDREISRILSLPGLPSEIRRKYERLQRTAQE